mgnify:CR=1 FL=1
MLYAEVVLPLPLNTTFTYAVPQAVSATVKVGHRVIVPFGRKKFYTAIVTALTNEAPGHDFEVKEIVMALDEKPILRRPQMQLWQWVSDYYLCAIGDVMKAALPAGLKVESETFIELSPDYGENTDAGMSERESIVVQCLEHASRRMSVADIEKATGLADVNGLAVKMLDKGLVIISEKLVERYTSRKVQYVRMAVERDDSEALHSAFGAVSRARKQEQALMALIEMSGFMRRNTPLAEVPMAALLERTGLTRPVVSELARKGLVEIYRKEINRFCHNGHSDGRLPQLSEAQAAALDSIHKSWIDRDVTLLHGVTSSGKTEIYIHLMADVMRRGRQVLYLVPEIALTTQLTGRLQRVFGDKVVIYHSKFSDNERVDIWRKVLDSKEPVVVIGARSAIFLPFYDLGMVIIDEEHETSYKQQDPAPRYNGRDTAMMLARMHGAKTLLGSATPAIDTYYKAQEGRYGLVTLSERYSGVQLPEIELVDMSHARKSGAMKGALAVRTVDLVKKAVDAGEQAILFLNRRGYAPVAVCKQCAWTPKCEYCDVSLTYHKRIDRLVCHYCGTPYPLPVVCPSCKEPAIEIYGYGTERMEDEVEQAFGGATVLRMDLDTTRNKDGYENIINEFSSGKARILVGTQMVTKGLDFDRVSVVAIVNSDALINQPDFRAGERAFNMISQVAGRAGRRDKRGLVVIQTMQPSHPMMPFILAHDYKGFYESELAERRRFNYPPFTRIINIYIKHRDRGTLEEISAAYGCRLRELFGNRVFGPEEPQVSRVQALYIRKIMLKVELNASMVKVKGILRETLEDMHRARIQAAKSVIVYYDVDPY